ncbi:hypothetical protein [Marinomonas sp. S3726]|uniref:hypothetical protein n=1 Tax=Marinomonas sp. S3726 TaxID=579484 RepID=UPI000698DB67|nr:hypothetical protein [Marinomonas sp. S3726]
MMIQVSGQYGDPRADDLFWPIQKMLNDFFKEDILGAYFKTIVMFSIVFRVSGKVRDFGSEGPERMKYLKKDAEITIDLVFPEHSWRGEAQNDLKQCVANGVRECLSLMLTKAQSIGEVEDAEGFKCDVEKVVSGFLDK